MRRRDFIAALGGAASGFAAAPFAAQSQQRALPVIGFLHNQSLESMRDKIPAFQEGLAKSGYMEGRNVAIEHGWAEGSRDRRRALLADLIGRKVSVLVADTTNGAADAKAATKAIPIVFIAGADPVEFGLVTSLSRPGANLTGVAVQGIEITGKRLDLLHKLVPRAGPIAMIAGPTAPLDAVGARFIETEIRDFQAAGRALGLPVTVIKMAKEGDIAPAFVDLVGQRAGALLVSNNILFQQERTQLILLSARHAIPTLFWESTAVPAGGLASYGPDVRDIFRQAGIYTGRILAGDRPADLPVVQPTRFELAINLKTAAVLGLNVPPTLLALADRVVE
jgi:putative tryptophan/tyrosine transport system substrate-binding protein